MGLTLKDISLRPTVVPEGMLPLRMRVLYITTYQRTGGWLAEAFAADSAVDVVLEEAVGLAAGLARLRDEVFEAVLVSHEPGELDALELLSGLRAGGSEQPLVVLGAQSEQEFSAPCYEVGADAYVCVNTVTTRTLIWIIARAIERHRLIGENRRLSQAERQRLHREHDEAQRLLEEQRAVIRDLEYLRPADSTSNDAEPAPAGGLISKITHDDDALQLPAQLIDHYRELLRAYVIMGSGNLSVELSVLADILAASGVTAAQTMKLHLDVLEELVRGLGSRSSRHVMTRADLLVLEVMIHLAEGYRQRHHERTHPPQQLTLPGFDNTPIAF